jgi:hypothetical protein
MRTHLPAALLATALASSLFAAPAQAAGAPRTFVSAAGSDSNNCTNVATPCRHLAAAFAATAADGEIYVLDPANYGSLTITHGVSIEGHGWASIAPVSGGNAITINANIGDKINIIGVVLDGTNLANTTGILFTSGFNLIVRDSVIRNFTLQGIDFEPNTPNTSAQIYVSNTLIADNFDNGIAINPTNGNLAVGVLDHVATVNNSHNGLFANAATGFIDVTITDSVSTNNEETGIFAMSSGNKVAIMVRNTTSSYNGALGLRASGMGAIVRVTRSTILGNNSGWGISSGGVVLSFADNTIDDNLFVNTSPPATGYK